MKMHRGPRSTDTWTRTDEKSAVDYASDWRPGRALTFDGTIDKSGARHTDLGVEIHEDDILALHSGLVRYLQACRDERDSLGQTVDTLESALVKISRLVSWDKDRAPDTESLLMAVRDIAEHFGRSWNRHEPFNPAAAWLRWESL